jgi:hypothetical protein
MFYGNVTLVDRLAIFGHISSDTIGGSDAIDLRPPTETPIIRRVAADLAVEFPIRPSSA